MVRWVRKIVVIMIDFMLVLGGLVEKNVCIVDYYEGGMVWLLK